MGDSRWVKIEYPQNGGGYYVFGIIYAQKEAKYLCFGLPATGQNPPPSMRGISQFFPTPGGGYWVMFQDAATGAEIVPSKK